MVLLRLHTDLQMVPSVATFHPRVLLSLDFVLILVFYLSPFHKLVYFLHLLSSLLLLSILRQPLVVGLILLLNFLLLVGLAAHLLVEISPEWGDMYLNCDFLIRSIYLSLAFMRSNSNALYLLISAHSSF